MSHVLHRHYLKVNKVSCAEACRLCNTLLLERGSPVVVSIAPMCFVYFFIVLKVVLYVFAMCISFFELKTNNADGFFVDGMINTFSSIYSPKNNETSK